LIISRFTMMTNEVQRFFRRLNHKPYGLTELVAIDRFSWNIVATGFFDDEGRFVSSCQTYNEQCNVYAGRNPRPLSFSPNKNLMDTVGKKRAKDRDIQHITGISLDIDPVIPKGQPASKEQRDAAVSFALDLQWDIGGNVDDSGNGSYLWIPFAKSIEIDPEHREDLKEQFRIWQENIKSKYKPEGYGLRIDGCFDFSRIKRVIGTVNHKADRLSRVVRRDHPDDTVRNEILSLKVPVRKKTALPHLLPSPGLPTKFKNHLKWDLILQDLWANPDPDRSKHDWMLGLSCLEAGISDPNELAAILMNNPHGKFRRDGRMNYVKTTVGKLLESPSDK
jgi:hypothetical protein